MNKLVCEYLSPKQSPSSSRQASCDSCDSNSNTRIQKPVKYKTQLCKTFEEKGCCPYETKCRFAHGRNDLVILESESKKRRCNGFWQNGCCSYGRRCRFGHEEISWQNSAYLMACEAQCSIQMPLASKLLKLLQ